MCSTRNFTPPARPGKIFFSLAELKKLVESENSCVSSVNCQRTITISPMHLKNLSSSVKELLNSEVTKFDVELQGVVLAHKNIKIIASSIQLSDGRYFPLEYIADIYVFKPKIGSKLTGVVNKIAHNKEYISVLVHNIFNVVVHSLRNQPRPVLNIGSEVTVAVTLIDFTGRIPHIKASIIPSDCEQTNQQDNSCDGNTTDSQETAHLPVQRQELLSILKNSPARLQSSTEAESSSAERDVANRIRTPGDGDVRKKKKKKKTNEKEVMNGEESSSSSKKRKRTAEDCIEEFTSPSKKKKKKDKHPNNDGEKAGNKVTSDELLGSQSLNPLETTMPLLEDASIFNAASSTPVLGPPQSSTKKKKKKKKDKLEKVETAELNKKESAIQRSLKQLKTELRAAPGDSGISSGDEKKSDVKKKIKSEPKSTDSVKSAKGDSSSVDTDSLASLASGKQNKKKKKVKKEKVDPMTAVYMDNLMNQALQSLKSEVSD